MKKLIIFLSLLLFCGKTTAQVTFDANAISFASSATAVTSLSVTTLTVGSGANRALIAQFSGNPTALACAWDPTGANQALVQTLSHVSSVTSQLWTLINPESGNKTLTCTFTSQTYVALNATSFTGVDQTGGSTTFYNANTNTGSGSTISLTITTNVNDAAIDSVTAEDNASLPTQSLLYTDPVSGGASSYAVGAGASVGFSWTSGTHPWVDVGFAIKSAAPVTQHNLTLLGVGQ